MVIDTEGFKCACPFTGVVDGCAGKTDVGCFRESGHEVGSQIAASGAVGFVDEDMNILAIADIFFHAPEFVDHGDDDATIVMSEHEPS